MATSPEASTLSLERFASDCKSLIVAAQTLADERKHSEVAPLHVLSAALAKNAGVGEVMRRAGVDTVELESAIERSLTALPKANEPAYLSAAALDLLTRAEREATREKRARVEVEDLLNALSQELRGPVGELLTAFRLGPGAFRPHLALLRGATRNATDSAASQPNELLRSLLDKTVREAELPVVGRAAELRRLLTVLERSTKHHPLLVGDPGVGKRAIVSELGRRLSQGDVPKSLEKAELFELETGALVSGARLRGEIEERGKKLLSRLQRPGDEPPILLVRGLEQLFGSNPALSGVPDLLRSALERGELRLLGTTTVDGARKLSERDPQFFSLLTPLSIQEPSVPEAEEMLRAVAARLAAHHQVNIGETAISSAVTLAHRYLQDRRLPESAIDLLDETASRKRITSDGFSEHADSDVRRLEAIEAQLAGRSDPSDPASAPVRLRLESERSALAPRVESIRAENSRRRAGGAAIESLVTAEDVAATLAAWTSIPVHKMLEGEADKLLDMEQRLGKRVVGQDHALSSLSRAVRRSRVGLRDPRRPIGSFLFLGPSGVGKTELAKALASQLFDDERALTRLDMSEFMERHMAQRLIGAPPGYADSEQGGFLTEAVRRRPYSVLLFDEVEKAHQDVFNLLLQLLDEGRLTDGRGRTADFSNTVVIMTSNIGSERILESDARLFETEDGREALRDVLVERLREFFRPELLNRIDDVLVFRPLSKDHLRRVVELELGHVEKLLQTRALGLRVSDAAKAHLVDLGYEPALGARPLKRVILRHVQDPLAEGLLSGRFAGCSAVRIELEGDALKLDGEPSAPAGSS
ncbi:MAG TPA: ATP-dependent Clp protease ATP-binding subunit [Polyangiaceae bacterium]|nr:ATP-dependent Clp protease ATP-binding subunit [Polyangiaceae bacterium]